MLLKLKKGMLKKTDYLIFTGFEMLCLYCLPFSLVVGVNYSYSVDAGLWNAFAYFGSGVHNNFVGAKILIKIIAFHFP